MTQEITASPLSTPPASKRLRRLDEPDRLAQWWGQGFTTTTQTADMRPGGVWQFVMHSPDGVDYPNRITFEDCPAGAHHLPPRRTRTNRAISTRRSPSTTSAAGTRLTMHMPRSSPLYQGGAGLEPSKVGLSTLGQPDRIH